MIRATVCSSCSVLENTMDGTVMKVSPFHFDSYIWQSSPFPCDENTITVSLIHNDLGCTSVMDDRCSAINKRVPLYEICNPEVTISGLTNAVHDDGLIMLKNEFNGQRANGTWSSADKSVKSKLGLLIGVGAHASVFHFSFQVINPNFAQNAQNIDLRASLLDGRNPEAAKVTWVDSQHMQHPEVDSIGPVDFKGKANADPTCNTVDFAGLCVKPADDGNDRRPMFVRPMLRAAGSRVV